MQMSCKRSFVTRFWNLKNFEENLNVCSNELIYFWKDDYERNFPIQITGSGARRVRDAIQICRQNPTNRKPRPFICKCHSQMRVNIALQIILKRRASVKMNYSQILKSVNAIYRTFFIFWNLRANAAPDGLGLKRRSIKLVKGYRLMCICIKLDEGMSTLSLFCALFGPRLLHVF